MMHELWAIREGHEWLFSERGLLDVAARFRAERESSADAAGRDIDGGVAVIDVRGPIVQSGGIAERYFGMQSSRAIAESVRAAADARDVGAILLRIDSPGGIVNGVGEASDAILDARGRGIPVIAHIAGQACSLAYWIASQCDRIHAERTTVCGCLGTIIVLYDTSRMLESAGVVTHVITRARFKATGVDGVPLDDEMLDFIRRRIDDGDALFRADVLRGRPALDWSAVSDGRFWGAEESRGLGLIDAVCGEGASMAYAMSAAAATFSRRSAGIRARLL